MGTQSEHPVAVLQSVPCDCPSSSWQHGPLPAGSWLTIGATGGIGRAVAEALAAHGWNVRALHRDPDRARAASPDLSVTWVRGDAMHEADVVAAAESVSILFHGANPPGYRRWRELAIPMLANAIAAAKASGARLIFPGNVYNFGPDAGAVVDESSPQNPTTRKGAVRVEMERMLAAAAAEAYGRLSSGQATSWGMRPVPGSGR
jgi:nucleoside-diphosphate-sugar epimerase